MIFFFSFKIFIDASLRNVLDISVRISDKKVTGIYQCSIKGENEDASWFFMHVIGSKKIVSCQMCPRKIVVVTDDLKFSIVAQGWTCRQLAEYGISVNASSEHLN